MQTANLNTISFGQKYKKPSRDYTEQEKAQMKDMKNAALENGWRDIYSGKKFGKKIHPTIEHFIPYITKDNPEIEAKIGNGFKINGLDNVFPVDGLKNMERSGEPFVKLVIKKPEVLRRLLVELENYRAYKSDLVDGEEWFKRLHSTIVEHLSGLCSNLKTKKLSIHK